MLRQGGEITEQQKGKIQGYHPMGGISSTDPKLGLNQLASRTR